MVLQCLYTIFKRKLQLDKYLVDFTAVASTIYFLVNIGIIPQICVLSVYLLLGIYCYTRFRTDIGETIVKYVVGLGLAAFIETVSAYSVALFQNILNENHMMLLSGILSLGISWVGPSQASILFKKVKQKYFRVFHWGIIWYAILLCCILIDYYANQEKISLHVVMLLTFLWLIYTGIYFIEIYHNEVEKKEQEIKLQTVYGETYAELLGEVRKRQHDFKNQLSAIYSMHLTANSLEELVSMQKVYGDKLLEECRFDSILTGCGNPILAGYIYHRCIACEKAGVAVDYHIHVDEVVCCFALHEVIEILGILIDNAMEYVLEQEDRQKCLRLDLREEKENITFTVANPARYLSSPEIERLFQADYSTKGVGRGLGLARIRELVKKYKTNVMVTNYTQDGDNWIDFCVIGIKKASKG